MARPIKPILESDTTAAQLKGNASAGVLGGALAAALIAAGLTPELAAAVATIITAGIGPLVSRWLAKRKFFRG